MKKIFLILIAISFIGCAAVESWFAIFTANKTQGNPETVFEFTVDTNDDIEGIYVNGAKQIISRNTVYELSFPVGEYEVSIITVNDAEDSLTITVEEIPVIPEPVIYTNVFKVSGYMRDTTTVLSLDWPILTYDGLYYNLSTMTPDVNGLGVKTSYVGNERIIEVAIDCSFYSFFYFMNDNMLNIEGIDSNNMSESEFIRMLTFIYAPPEPEIPEYSITRYHLSGYSRSATDELIVTEGNIILKGITYDDDYFPSVYSGDTRTVQVGIDVDFSDYYLFMEGNTMDKFGFGLSSMTRDEFVWISDVIRRYPEESIWVLQEEWYETKID